MKSKTYAMQIYFSLTLKDNYVMPGLVEEELEDYETYSEQDAKDFIIDNIMDFVDNMEIKIISKKFSEEQNET